jgi:predicted nicotinamide N-methyase
VPTAETFIRAHTRPAPVALVPEVCLHQADEPIALWERTERGAGGQQPPPFWAFAWAGGQALARYLLDHPTLVAGRRVLDLAAGSGLVAIAAARAGAAAVTANDIDPLSLAAVTVNAAANDVAVTVLPGDLLDADTEPDADRHDTDTEPDADRHDTGSDTGSDRHATGTGSGSDTGAGAGSGSGSGSTRHDGGTGRHDTATASTGQGTGALSHGGAGAGTAVVAADVLLADVVLAGDVFYSREMAARVLPFLRRAAARDAVVLVGDPGRAYLPRSGLRRLAVYDVPVPEALESTTVRRTTVWQVDPPGVTWSGSTTPGRRR